MYMIFNHPRKGWSLGVLYDIPGIPDHLKMFLQNNDGFRVQDLVHWLYGHNVRGVAYCTGSWLTKMKCRRFVNQFNASMENCEMLAELGELYEVVMATEERIKREAAAGRNHS